tara:strand:- start:1359 stop:1547 length:189 start_codon:yes stop_codon:yes gene_type:complete
MGNNDVIKRIRRRAFELRHLRKEGFEDSSLNSKCIIQEIKFLFNMLNEKQKDEILNKPWLDE